MACFRPQLCSECVNCFEEVFMLQLVAGNILIIEVYYFPLMIVILLSVNISFLLAKLKKFKSKNELRSM